MKRTRKAKDEIVKQRQMLVIARHIRGIKQGVDDLLNGPLNRSAVILLIQHASKGRPKAKLINDVLGGMENIQNTYFKDDKTL